MEKKLQELTEKIYSEGIEKAKEEAEKIEKDASQKAQSEIDKAEDEAKKIIENANKKAEEIKRNGESEMKLAAKQTLAEIRQNITDIITVSSISDNVKEAFSDNGFIKELITLSVKAFDPEGSADLEVVLPVEKKKELEAFLKERASKLIDGGIEVNFSEDISGGFKIGPADGSYKLSFSDADFKNYFKRYLRPKTAKLLFEGE